MTLKNTALKLKTFLDDTFPDQVFYVTPQPGLDTFTVQWEMDTFNRATKNLVHYKVLGELLNPESPIYGVRDDRVMYCPIPTVAREEFVRTIVEEDPVYKEVYFNPDPRVNPIGFYNKSTDEIDVDSNAVYYHLLYEYALDMSLQYSDYLDLDNERNPPESKDETIYIYMQPLDNASTDLYDDITSMINEAFTLLKAAIANTYTKANRVDELSKTNFNKLLTEFIIKTSIRQYQVNSLNKIYSQ